MFCADGECLDEMKYRLSNAMQKKWMKMNEWEMFACLWKWDDFKINAYLVVLMVEW